MRRDRVRRGQLVRGRSCGMIHSEWAFMRSWTVGEGIDKENVENEMGGKDCRGL